MAIADALRHRIAPRHAVDPFVRTGRQYALARGIPGTVEHVVSMEGRLLLGTAPAPEPASAAASRRIALAAARAWLDTALRNRDEVSQRPTRGVQGALRAAGMGLAALTGLLPPRARDSDAAWISYLQRALEVRPSSLSAGHHSPGLREAVLLTALQRLSQTLAEADTVRPTT